MFRILSLLFGPPRRANSSLLKDNGFHVGVNVKKVINDTGFVAGSSVVIGLHSHEFSLKSDVSMIVLGTYLVGAYNIAKT
jgi:hypothetical protein